MTARRARNLWLRRTIGLLLIVGIIGFAFEAATWPNVRALASRPPTTTAFIERYKAREREAGHTPRIDWRWVPSSAISIHLKRAVVVAEDTDFFYHNGFAPKAMREAMTQALEERRAPRGASTLTQQLAKNLWLSPERTVLRKARETVLTWQLERALSKRRILEFYDIHVALEDAPLGQRALELPGQHGLAGLAQHRALGREPEVLGELLRERRGPARRPALLQCLRHRLAHGFGREAVVVEEVGVLGDDDGAFEMDRDGGGGDPAPVDARGVSALPLARLIALDEGGRRRRSRRERAHVGPRGGLEGEPDDADDQEQPDRPAEPQIPRATRGHPLERQQLVAQRLVVAQGGGGAAEADGPLLEHVDAVREAQRELRVLLGEQDREAGGLEPRDLLAEMIDDQRGQALRGLVEQQ